jgi:hypothetical protein
VATVREQRTGTSPFIIMRTCFSLIIFQRLSARLRAPALVPYSAFLRHPTQPLNRTAMAKKHAGKWLALEQNRQTIIATGTSAKEALHGARRKGVEHPVLTRMPREMRHFVGTVHRSA